MLVIQIKRDKYEIQKARGWLFERASHLFTYYLIWTWWFFGDAKCMQPSSWNAVIQTYRIRSNQGFYYEHIHIGIKFNLVSSSNMLQPK